MTDKIDWLSCSRCQKKFYIREDLRKDWYIMCPDCFVTGYEDHKEANSSNR